MYHSQAMSALRDSPGRYMFTRWPWRSAAYLAFGAVFWWLSLMSSVLVLPLPYWAHALARAERRLVRLAGFRPIPGPPARSGLPGLHELRLWREVAFTLVHILFGLISFMTLIITATLIFAGIVAVFVLAGVETSLMREPSGAPALVVLSAVLVIVSPYLFTLLAYGQGALATALLSPRMEELQSQVVSLARANIAELERFESERQRIERDLHDGTQQHLATATMRLGMLELELRDALRPGPEQSSVLESLEAVRREDRAGAGHAARHRARAAAPHADRRRTRHGSARTGAPGARTDHGRRRGGRTLRTAGGVVAVLHRQRGGHQRDQARAAGPHPHRAGRVTGSDHADGVG